MHLRHLFIIISLSPSLSLYLLPLFNPKPLTAPPPPHELPHLWHHHHHHTNTTIDQKSQTHNRKPCYLQSYHHRDPLSSLKPMTTIYRYSDQTTNQRVQTRKREEQERENHHRGEERQAREREESE